MLNFDPSALRAQVIRDYQLLAHGIRDATEMNQFADAVMFIAVSTVRGRLQVYNQGGSAGRLPAKLLAACFAHLPFSSCIHASHVCRSWRDAALGEPALWSHIFPSYRSCNKLELIRMALPRAGTLPVDLLVSIDDPIEPGVFNAIIAPFSHQLRYIASCDESPTSSWDFPAPKMEGFSCVRTMAITPELFGGAVGRLRCMYLQCVYLPSVCPVLSTVTDLRVRLTPLNGDATPSTLGNIFALFPSLQWLQISSITRRASHMLPAGPAPASLKELELSCDCPEYDLMPHYLAWDSGSLRHVSLSQDSGILPDLSPLAQDAVRLAVNYVPRYDFTEFMFEHADSVSRLASLSHLKITAAAALLAAIQSRLTAVHTVIVSHVALHALSGVIATLSGLEQLVVHVAPQKVRAAAPYTHPFAWDALSCLSDIARALSALRSVTLQVSCGHATRQSFLTAEHARGLVAQLRDLDSSVPPPLEIQGFPAEALTSIDITGLNVQFDVAPVYDLILEKERGRYFPFP